MIVGILGGGQLCKMLALSGIPLGIKFMFYFPEKGHSLEELGKIVHGEFEDLEKLKFFATEVDVITYENENIPIKTLEFLEKLTVVYPKKAALLIAQDRLFEKDLFVDLEIPTNQYFEVNNFDELTLASKKLGFPFILKKRRNGYDGKGQYKINNASDLLKLDPEQYENAIAEEFINFDRELSLIGVRAPDGQCVYYDVCENTHENGILRKTVNRQNDLAFESAKEYLNKILMHFDYVGVLTLEYFEKNRKLIANEIAPRVHNSGHWTIDAAITSQFENHLRSILHLPLGDTNSLMTCSMFNILGKIPDKTKLLSFHGLCLHDYLKGSQRLRKVGHITLLKPHNNSELTTLTSLLNNDDE